MSSGKSLYIYFLLFPDYVNLTLLFYSDHCTTQTTTQIWAGKGLHGCKEDFVFIYVLADLADLFVLTELIFPSQK